MGWPFYATKESTCIGRVVIYDHLAASEGGDICNGICKRIDLYEVLAGSQGIQRRNLVVIHIHIVELHQAGETGYIGQQIIIGTEILQRALPGRRWEVRKSDCD